jgi:citrate lyase subunit beta / citryl-CoA lyase
MNPHRSLLFVPAIREDMLQKASKSEADIIVLDLEDSVPPAEKATARDLARRYAPDIAAGGRQVHLRVNAISTGLARDDLRALAPAVSGLSLPKTEQPQDVRDLDVLLREAELREEVKPGATDLVLWIESPAGLLRVRESLAASTRVAAVALGHEDYTNELAIQRTSGGEELDFARNLIAVEALAARVIPLDGPYSDFRNLDGLRTECARIKQMGYKGRFAIHPAQLSLINETFTPLPEEVEYARRVVEAFDAGVAQGLGAVQLDGKMIDIPVARRARTLLETAEAVERRVSSP